MRIMRFMHKNKTRITQLQVSPASTPLGARIATMRAGGMSSTAIRRALGLNEAAAVASGLLVPKAVTEAFGLSGQWPGRAAAERCARGRAEGPTEGRVVFEPEGHAGRGPDMTPEITKVRDAAARVCGLDPATLSERDQRRPAVRARQLAIYLIRKLCPGVSLLSIGLLLDRDPTTVHYGYRRAAVLLGRDAGFREDHDRARRELGRGATGSGQGG